MENHNPFPGAEWIQYHAESLDSEAAHDLLKCVVIPRPIAWITTMRPNGLVNVAPFSCYAIASFEPMLVVVGFEHALGKKQKKDTLCNIERTKELVIHTVTEDLVEAVNATGRSAPTEESKLETCGLTPVASIRVSPPRIGECPLAMECRATQVIAVGKHHHLVIAEGLVVHARKDILREGKIDLQRLRPVGRLNNNSYVRLGDKIALARPKQ